jgi:2-polyprenyl-3-methyl-5-hydroxy-6-metoxy-1,4-benzoquinol methylase
MTEFYKSNIKYIGVIVVLAVFLSGTLSYLLRLSSMPYFLVITYKSSVESETQVFYDTGNGYNEKESITYQVLPSKSFKKLNFSLPTEKIHNLRIDPLINEGLFQIKKVVIKGRHKIQDDYEILHEFDVKSFKAIQDISLSVESDGGLVVDVPPSAIDPILEISLQKILDHWEFKDFLDKKWFTDTVFVAFLLAPLSILVLPINRKRNALMHQVAFKFKGNSLSLKGGDIFRLEASYLCYRDISSEVLKSFIDDIAAGLDWKESAKVKLQKQNPWLFDIISSSRRTKFLDEFTKPSGLRILDIGAGWGQFCTPLAKKNSVCALEPTPERLDFIKTISEQQNVSKCMSFICANYQDIEFQTKFDLILCIGVLEWVGKFTNSETPPESTQLEFLKKMKKDLSKKGGIVIGIENRLGLKYLFGANDDHIGLPNISCFCKEIAKSKFKQKTSQDLQCLTYSIMEYKDLLHRAGFSIIKFYASLPDYKLPDKIFPISDDCTKCELNNFINDGGKVEEHDGSNGKKLENLDEIYSMYHSLAEMNLAHYFAPSFFIEAS